MLKRLMVMELWAQCRGLHFCEDIVHLSSVCLLMGFKSVLKVRDNTACSDAERLTGVPSRGGKLSAKATAPAVAGILMTS